MNKYYDKDPNRRGHKQTSVIGLRVYSSEQIEKLRSRGYILFEDRKHLQKRTIKITMILIEFLRNNRVVFLPQMKNPRSLSN